MLLSPRDAHLRLFNLTDDAASYLTRWIRRLLFVGVFGYALGEVALLLGLSEVAHDFLQKIIGFILHLMLAVMVVQKRRAVRAWLRAADDAGGVAANLRNRFAAVWHWAALFLLISVWIVSAVEVPHGYAALVRYVILTTLVLIGARLAIVVVLGLVDRVMLPEGKSKSSPKRMSSRLRVYHSSVSALLRFGIWVLATLGLLQLYGLNSFVWSPR
jgi:hypothetical protein